MIISSPRKTYRQLPTQIASWIAKSHNRFNQNFEFTSMEYDSSNETENLMLKYKTV